MAEIVPVCEGCMSHGVLIGGEADVSPRPLGVPAHWLTLQPHQTPLHVIASLLMPSAVMCFYNISSTSLSLFQNRCLFENTNKSCCFIVGWSGNVLHEIKYSN